MDSYTSRIARMIVLILKMVRYRHGRNEYMQTSSDDTSRVT